MAAQRGLRGATSFVCFASAKGGSGKTVISASIARLLGNLGKRILLIDTDAATNGLTLLYLSQLNDVKRKFPAPAQVRLSGTFDIGGGFDVVPLDEGVDLLPATFTMMQTEDVAIEDFRDRLAGAKASIGRNYDYVIFDAQAGADLFALVAIEASEMAVIVSEYDPVSAEGVERLRRMFGNIPAMSNSWVLFNKVLPDFANEQLAEFLSVTHILPPVPWDAAVIRAFTRRQLALDLKNGNPYTISLVAIARALFLELEADIDKWITSRAARLKAPVIDRINDLDAQLEAVENTISQLTSEKAREAQTYMVTVAVSATVLLIGGGSLVLALTQSSRHLVTYLVYVGLVGALLMLTTAVMPILISQLAKRNKKVKLDFDMQMHELERTVSELREERAKYETLAHADLRSLVQSGHEHMRF